VDPISVEKLDGVVKSEAFFLVAVLLEGLVIVNTPLIVVTWPDCAVIVSELIGEENINLNFSGKFVEPIWVGDFKVIVPLEFRLRPLGFFFRYPFGPACFAFGPFCFGPWLVFFFTDLWEFRHPFACHELDFFITLVFNAVASILAVATWIAGIEVNCNKFRAKSVLTGGPAFLDRVSLLDKLIEVRDTPALSKTPGLAEFFFLRRVPFFVFTVSTEVFLYTFVERVAIFLTVFTEKTFFFFSPAWNCF
jgi:hypothetical protein